MRISLLVRAEIHPPHDFAAPFDIPRRDDARCYVVNSREIVSIASSTSVRAR